MRRYGAQMAGLLALVPGMALAEEPPAQSPSPASPHWELSLGASYSDGSYDALEKTYVTAFPVSLRYANEGLWVRVMVPYVILRGPANLLDAPQPFGAGGRFNPGGGELDGAMTIPRGAVVPGDPLPISSRADGLGDVALTLGYRFDLGDLTHLSFSTRLKLPTARVSDGLGTGKADLILGGDLTRDIGPAMVTVGLRHRFTGEPEAMVLRDTWSLDGNVAWRIGGHRLVGLDYEWRQSVVPGNPVSNDLTAWTSLPLIRATRIDLYGGTGIGRGGAALLGGAALRWKF